MKATETGKLAEAAVASFLAGRGYSILARNWRTRICEIDVVAKKDGIIYLVEVKYRASDNQGDGFSYITPKKLKQMNFAAAVWCQQNDWEGDYRLLAAAVDSTSYRLQAITEV